MFSETTYFLANLSISKQLLRNVKILEQLKYIENLIGSLVLRVDKPQHFIMKT